jgi:hypothetical protein
MHFHNANPGCGVGDDHDLSFQALLVTMISFMGNDDHESLFSGLVMIMTFIFQGK